MADWYLELVKPRLRDDAEERSRQAARTTLITALDGILRLLHPIIPFVTEELWQKLPWPQGETKPRFLISAPWPVRDPANVDPEAEGQMEAIQELITQIRRLRKEYGVPEGAKVSVSLTGAPDPFREALGFEDFSVRRLARVSEISMAEGDGDTPEGSGAHAVLKNGTELLMPLEGVIDLDQERNRLAGEISRLAGQLKGVQAKLANAKFMSRAPAEVVDREREKERSFQGQLEKLQEKLKALQS